MQELERLRSSLQNAGFLIYESPENSDTIEWSGAVAGAALSDLSGLATREKFISCIHADDKDRYKEATTNLFQKGGRFRMEYRVMVDGNKILWVEDTASLSGDKETRRMVG